MQSLNHDGVLEKNRTLFAHIAASTIALPVKTVDFEQAGCVFLPAAGYRIGTSVYYGETPENYGYYWSKTGVNGVEAYRVNFTDNEFDTDVLYYPRKYGYSVRLVHYNSSK